MAIDLSPLTAALSDLKEGFRVEDPEIAVVIYPHNGHWYWRIEVAYQTVEDCDADYENFNDAVEDARRAHAHHTARLALKREG